MSQKNGSKVELMVIALGSARRVKRFLLAEPSISSSYRKNRH